MINRVETCISTINRVEKWKDVHATKDTFERTL